MNFPNFDNRRKVDFNEMEDKLFSRKSTRITVTTVCIKKQEACAKQKSAKGLEFLFTIDFSCGRDREKRKDRREQRKRKRERERERERDSEKQRNSGIFLSIRIPRVSCRSTT